MSERLTPDEVKQQSISCYAQWAEKWRENAKFHGTRFPMKSLNDFAGMGVGKAALCIANGYSFEEQIETIKTHQKNVDIVACDKTIQHCLQNDIKVDFCVVCDANVSYEKYLEAVKDKLQDTVLIINVTANTKWATLGNWKDVYFFVNQDILKSEEEFAGLSGCQNIIVAATNVSGQMVVALTQSDNENRRNHFGYDRYLLIGFDYSWGDESYYAFDKEGGGKINYMRNIYLRDLAGRFVYTSTNLMFSARWFETYLKAFKLPVFQCSDRSIIAGLKGVSNLEHEMQYRYHPWDSHLVQKLVKMKAEIQEQLKDIETRLEGIAFDHLQAIEAY